MFKGKTRLESTLLVGKCPYWAGRDHLKSGFELSMTVSGGQIYVG